MWKFGVGNADGVNVRAVGKSVRIEASHKIWAILGFLRSSLSRFPAQPAIKAPWAMEGLIIICKIHNGMKGTRTIKRLECIRFRRYNRCNTMKHKSVQMKLILSGNKSSKVKIESSFDCSISN